LEDFPEPDTPVKMVIFVKPLLVGLLHHSSLQPDTARIAASSQSGKGAF